MGTPAGTSSLPLPAPDERRERRSHARLRRRLVGLVSALVASLCLLYSSLVWYALEGVSSSLRRWILGAGALGALLLLGLAIATVRSFIAAMLEASEQRWTELRSSTNAALVSAEAKSRFLSQFLADMSQDIRAPMNGVLGMTQLVLSSRLDPTQERQMRTIDGAARALLRMVSDILDVSKLEADRYELLPMGCSLHDILRVSFDLLEARAKDKGLKLELRIADDVPDQVLLDAGRLQQVLINLAQSAIDRTDEGWVQIVVRASKLTERGFELCVRIEGTRAAAPTREREGPSGDLALIDASARVDERASGETPLGGLGLVISKKLVALMGGEISGADREEPGAVFEVVVPVPRITDPAGRAGEPSSPTSPLQIRLPSPTAPLLVVDADGLSQMVAVELLENLGFDVEVASSGQEAIELIERKRYALILMDCQLPERGGYLAAQRIRALHGTQNRTPIIGCSRSGSREDRSKAIAAGLDDHLDKPLERSALCNVLARWLPDEANPASSGTRLSHTALLRRAAAKGPSRKASADGALSAPDGTTTPPDPENAAAPSSTDRNPESP